MAKHIRYFSRIAVSDSNGDIMGYVHTTDDGVKIFRGINWATCWSESTRYHALKLCDELNGTHALLQFEVLDYEEVQTERLVKPRRQTEE